MRSVENIPELSGKETATDVDALDTNFVLRNKITPAKQIKYDLSNCPTDSPTIIDPLFGKYVHLHSQGSSGTGAGSDSVITICIVPFKKWRVIECGVWINAAGAATVAELVHFGTFLSDIGATDDDAFAVLTQDTSNGKQWASGDMLSMKDPSYLATQDPEDNAGAHTWTEGILFNKWQTKQAVLIMTKKNVGGSLGTVRGWVILELGSV